VVREGMGDSLWGSLIAFLCGSMKSDRSCEVGVTMLGDAIWCGCVQYHVGVFSIMWVCPVRCRQVCCIYAHAYPIMYVCTYPSRCAGGCAGVHFICSRLSVQLLMLPQ